MPDAPAAAPTTAPVEHVDALSWLDDPKNFEADSPAAQKVYDLPPDDGRPRAAPATPDQPDREVLGKDEVKPGEKTAREALSEQITGKDAEGEPGYTQDETGRWHRPDGAFADAKEVDAIETVLSEGKDGAKPDAPAAAAADKPEKTATKSKQPIGDVQVYDKDGNVVAELPELAITYAADGKKLEKIPLDKLIRKAQLGEYNEQREQESLASRQKAEQLTARTADLEAAITQYQQFFERALTDDQFFQVARAQHQQAQSPEARLAVREQELRTIEQRHQQTEQRSQATAFVAQNIAPRINALTEQYKDSLSPEALYGKFALLTGPMLVNGQIPLNRLPEVVRIIDRELTPWAETHGESRAKTESAALATARQQVEATKVALTLAKKTQARALKPQGASGSIRESPKPLPPPKSAEEANDRMFEQIERDYGGATR